MKQLAPNVNVISVNLRFSATQMEIYAKFITDAVTAGKKIFIFADREARVKVKELFPKFMGIDVLEKINVNAYPANELTALNVGRGISNMSAIFISETGRYTEQIAKTAAATKDHDVLIVECNKVAA